MAIAHVLAGEVRYADLPPQPHAAEEDGTALNCLNVYQPTPFDGKRLTSWSSMSLDEDVEKLGGLASITETGEQRILIVPVAAPLTELLRANS